jgi:hypothetical protein
VKSFVTEAIVSGESLFLSKTVSPVSRSATSIERFFARVGGR